MKAVRPPWWMIVLSASFVATLGLIFYLVLWGPAHLKGIVATFEDGSLVIRSLAAESQAAKGGLRAGDRVLTIDGRPMHGPGDWISANANLQVGRAHRWLVSRGEDRVTLDIVALRCSVQNRLSDSYIQYVSHVLSGLLLGILIAWKRPADPVARIGAWFLMTASIAFGFPQGWAVAWRELPAMAQLLLWIPQISRFVIEGIFLSFFLVFPRRLVTRRWLWLLLWAPVLATLPWRVAGFNAVIHPGHAASAPTWILQAGIVRTMVYLAIGIVVLAFSYRRLLDLNEKRRIRVLMVGTGASVLSSIATVWYFGFSGQNLSGRDVLFSLTVIPFNTAGTLSFAYAILRHRILDIQVIIRQGLQYALARGFVLALVPALGVLLISDLAMNSQEPLARIMERRGWIYIGLAGAALAVHWKRKQWLDALDRRFFRERYDARRLLGDVVDEIRSARSLERVASRVVTQIETALHPEFVSLMMQEPDQPDYHVLAVAPANAVTNAPSTLGAGSKLVGLARVLGKPLEVLITDSADSAWLERGLPQSEIDLVRQRRIDLIVPVAGFAGGTQALLILGIKRSEEPYTRDDRELLETIAASLALLLEQPAAVGGRPGRVFNECPECGTCYDSVSETCELEGAHLLPVHLPRTLAGRYRLERRRGRGGMGTVYEAVDGSLDRRVAVKVIRDDLLSSVEAAERFQREARAAAAFAHPNVVTVHDYGIDGSRAFLVMELLEGLTLREELNRCRRLNAPRVLDILRDVCAAMDAAHRRQLIHRDLKPENIFLAPGSAKVLDFGIAKFLPSLDGDAATQVAAQTRTGFLIGTLAYMSPEQLLGEAADVTWDLWALAVVAYEALTGVLPFPSVSTVEWRRAVLNGGFTPLSEYFAEPSERWHAFFKHSFAPDRTMRPKSAAELMRSLERAFS